jgi:Skp family chaperone for outer membrane proteins
MKICTINFETIVRVFKPYIDSSKLLEEDRRDHMIKMNSYKSEMQTIIDSTQTIILDEKTKKEKMEKFGKIQNEAGKADTEFRAKIVKKEDEYMKKIYSDISEIVSGWANVIGADMVISNTEVIYFTPSIDITHEIIHLIKEKDLYIETSTKEKESI